MHLVVVNQCLHVQLTLLISVLGSNLDPTDPVAALLLWIRLITDYCKLQFTVVCCRPEVVGKLQPACDQPVYIMQPIDT